MLLKLGRYLTLGVAGLTLAQVAMAADGAGANATVANAQSLKVGGDFRGEFLYDDHGQNKVANSPSPTRTTTLGVDAVDLYLSGNLNSDTEYALKFNLLTPAFGPLEYGYGTHWFTKTVGFSLGKERVMQGGWDHMDGDYRSSAEGAYKENLVMQDYQTMLAVHVKVAGEITLQILNDIKSTDGPAAAPTPTNVASGTLSPNIGTGPLYNTQQAYYNVASNPNGGAEEHPTMVIGWTGDFGPIKPLLDFGSYDNNKSMWYDISLKTEMAGLAATIGYWGDSEKVKTPSATGKNDVVTTNMLSAFNLNIAYEVKNVVTPWIYYSNYNNKEGGTDYKFNVVTSDGTAHYNDNGDVFGVGVNLDFFGKNFNPFLAYTYTTGKYLKNQLNPAGESETRKDSVVKLGVLASI